jgi:hypothetical protein
MKVSRVEVIPLEVPLDYAYRPHPQMETILPVIVRLYSDAGLDSFRSCVHLCPSEVARRQP